jgi:plastocyanin
MKSPLLFLMTVAAVTFAGDTTVVQKDREFSQNTLTIKAGDSVTFKNEDAVTHNVFSNTPGLEFDIRRQAPGGSSTVPFAKEGEVEVRCSIHPKMKLMISVKK